MVPTNTENPRTSWTLPPAMQAALDAANLQLAELARQHMPPAAAAPPPSLAQDLVAWGKIKLQPAGLQLLSAGMSSQAYFETLVEHDCLADARRILAHALPKRRALWWGVLAAHDAFRDEAPPELMDVLRLATRFVVSPTEDLRQAAGEVARRLRPNTIAGCLATALFFSSGSVSPAGLPPVAPRPFVTGRLVGVCVYLASVTRDAALYKHYLREYLRWGRAIAAGELRWPQPTPGSPRAASRLDTFWSPRSASTEVSA